MHTHTHAHTNSHSHTLTGVCLVALRKTSSWQLWWPLGGRGLRSQWMTHGRLCFFLCFFSKSVMQDFLRKHSNDNTHWWFHTLGLKSSFVSFSERRQEHWSTVLHTYSQSINRNKHESSHKQAELIIKRKPSRWCISFKTTSMKLLKERSRSGGVQCVLADAQGVCAWVCAWVHKQLTPRRRQTELRPDVWESVFTLTILCSPEPQHCCYTLHN